MALFSHLALKFGSHPENLATEALGYILGRSADARGALLKAMGPAAASLTSSLQFHTQAHSEDSGRPDLAGVDPDGATRVLVEAKFSAGFTQHQPVGYLSLLPETGALLVVAPAARLAHVWRELLHRVASAKLESTILAEPGELGHVTVGTRHLVITSWRRLLNAMALELSGEPAVLADVAQLQALCDRMDAEAFVPVTSEELTSNAVRRVHEFGYMVDEIATKLSAEGVASQKGLRATAANGWYGRYLLLRGVGVILHVSTHKWTKLAPSPLWVTVFGANWQDSDKAPAKKAIAAYEAAHPGSVYADYQGFPAVMLRVPPGAERHEIIDAVCAQLREVGDVIAPFASGGAAPAPTEGDVEA